ncbi:MAG: tRNA 2-thiouridine(34) synthase MnmA [Bacillota bacterium]
MPEKALVAMSGGVDSSVAAYLLKNKGYDVLGVTMQIWPHDQMPREGDAGCCSLTAVDDARSVANKLDIPFYVLNFRQLFQEKVINYFLNEYLMGRTPNPCIACNRFVKFDALLKKAISLGVDYIATGHYAKIFYDGNRNRYLMSKAKDVNKDQTYVLYGFNQEQLAKTLMPLGEYEKVEIREIAAKLDLRVADKPESQEICFVPDDNYRNFIQDKVKDIKKGPFIDKFGNQLGTHEGIPFYTIGQRKGLGLALGYPAYVIDIIPEKNTVVIGKKEDVFSKGLISEDNNFILIDDLHEPMEVEVKIRYKAEPIQAMIYPYDHKRVRVEFAEPAKAVTPGQAAVYYMNDLVVGGGIIINRF